MKRRLNLYTESYYPKVEFFTFNSLLGLSGLLIVGLLLAQAYLQHKYEALNIERNQAQSVVDDRQDILEELTSAVTSREQDADLVASLSLTQDELALKQRLLSEVKGRENLKSKGFSVLLLDLARYHEPELWLTSIAVDQENMRFAGQAADSTSVPKWVKQLGNASSFKGHEFAGTRVYRQDNQLHFVLSSQLSNLETKAAADEK